MKIAISARMRNGYLWEAVEKAGSVKALAGLLGVEYSTVIDWLNFRRYPDYKNPKSKRDWKKIEKQIVKLTGHLLEDVFPVELQSSDFLERPKLRHIVQEVPTVSLTGLTERPLLPPSSLDTPIEQADLSKIVGESLNLLTPREAKVLKMRFGIGDEDEKSLQEIAAYFCISPTRIQQIESKALRKLRNPARHGNMKLYLPK